MLMLYDFECSKCGHIQEALVRSYEREGRCLECGARTDRIITPINFKLDGTDPAYPTAYDKWAKSHEKTGKQSKE